MINSTYRSSTEEKNQLLTKSKAKLFNHRVFFERKILPNDDISNFSRSSVTAGGNGSIFAPNEVLRSAFPEIVPNKPIFPPIFLPKNGRRGAFRQNFHQNSSQVNCKANFRAYLLTRPALIYGFHSLRLLGIFLLPPG